MTYIEFKRKLSTEISQLLREKNQYEVENIVDRILELIQSIITSEVKSGGSVKWKNLGVFMSKFRKGRALRGVRNQGEVYQIPDLRLPKFKPSREFTNSVKTIQ